MCFTAGITTGVGKQRGQGQIETGQGHGNVTEDIETEIGIEMIKNLKGLLLSS
jgi:hypothetical protein